MEETKQIFTTIDAYIAQFPPEKQALLAQIRAVIREAAPEAGEKISYGMPTFTYYGNLVHFALFEKHIGFYPVPSGLIAFEEELKGFKTGKGSVQFPLEKPLPLDLIRRIVLFRYEENRKVAEAKKQKK